MRPSLLRCLRSPRVGSNALAISVSSVPGRHDTERADDRERPRFGATQSDLLFADSDLLALGTARQVQVLREHVARIDGGAFSCIRRSTAAALAQLATVVVIARIATPTDGDSWPEAKQGPRMEALPVVCFTRFEGDLVGATGFAPGQRPPAPKAGLTPRAGLTPCRYT
jgi:hypothetical protein